MDNETLQKQVSKIVRRKPSSHTFISLVGKTTEVFLSSRKRKGCHWTMTCVYLVSNTWFYCDTLGSNPPSDLKKEVLEAINNIHCLPKKHFKKYFNCHMPSSANVYHHKCSSKCFKNIPFQTCGNVCGVIVAILAVVAQKIPNIWQDVIFSQTCTLPSGLNWLLEPTTYSDYLREVIISWLVEGETNVAFIENCLKSSRSPVLKVMEDIQPFMTNPIVANVAHSPVLNVLEDTQKSVTQPTVVEETQSYVTHSSV